MRGLAVRMAVARKDNNQQVREAACSPSHMAAVENIELVDTVYLVEATELDRIQFAFGDWAVSLFVLLLV